jgi:hypothetical protein
MSNVVTFGPRRHRPGDFTPAELERALAVVHAAVEEYRKDYRTARLRDRHVVKLLDGFGHYLSGREEYQAPDETEPEHAQ